MRRSSWGVGAVWSSLVMMACNDHPLAPVDAVLTSATRTTVTLPARQKLDLLFVVDNSGSMAQEQANLTRNFGTLSRFLFDELGASSDFRIAVISTDLRDSRHRGRFVGAPARPSTPGATRRRHATRRSSPVTASRSSWIRPSTGAGFSVTS